MEILQSFIFEPDQFAHVQDALRQTGVEEFKVAEFEMLPQTDIELSEDDQATFEKLIDALKTLKMFKMFSIMWI